jgi:dihydroxyacid dehydratase/phosphogluconate dehydratase
VNNLSDPDIPLKDLISLREIAKALQEGMLSETEVLAAQKRICPNLAGCFTNMATAPAVIELIDALVEARSPAAARPLRAERLRFKATECRQLAENARDDYPRQIYQSLAISYEQMASRADQIEKQR